MARRKSPSMTNSPPTSSPPSEEWETNATARVQEIQNFVDEYSKDLSTDRIEFEDNLYHEIEKIVNRRDEITREKSGPYFFVNHVRDRIQVIGLRSGDIERVFDKIGDNVASGSNSMKSRDSDSSKDRSSEDDKKTGEDGGEGKKDS